MIYGVRRGTKRFVGNRLVVVDVANIRPDLVVHERGLGRPTDQNGDPLTSIAFIDSLLHAISGQIPNASVVAIADRVLQHRFESPSDQEVFRERTKLPVTEPEYIYLMPPKGARQVPRKLLARLGKAFVSNVGKADDPDFVKADELILAVAAANEGLVVSADRYVDPKYRDLVECVAPSHYVPMLDGATGEWLLCPKSRYYGMSWRVRRDSARVRSIAGIDSAHRTTTHFDRESDTLLRRHIFETFVPQFWSGRNIGDPVFTVGDGSPTTQRLVLPRELSEPKTRDSKLDAKREPAVEPEIHAPAREPDRAMPMVATNLVRRRLAATLWASSSASNLRYRDQVVEMIGQVFEMDEGTLVLRWIYPSGSIRIVGDVASRVRRGIDVVKLQGQLRFNGDELVLDVNVFATRQVEAFDLYDFYQRQIKRIQQLHVQPKPRRWSPPTSKRIRAVAQEIVRPRRESVNEPELLVDLIDPQPLEKGEIIEVVRPIQPEADTRARRQRSKFATLSGLIAVFVVAAAALFFAITRGDSVGTSRATQNLLVETSSEDGDTPSEAFSSVYTNAIYRYGKMVVRR